LEIKTLRVKKMLVYFHLSIYLFVCVLFGTVEFSRSSLSKSYVRFDIKLRLLNYKFETAFIIVFLTTVNFCAR